MSLVRSKSGEQLAVDPGQDTAVNAHQSPDVYIYTPQLWAESLCPGISLELAKGFEPMTC